MPKALNIGRLNSMTELKKNWLGANIGEQESWFEIPTQGKYQIFDTLLEVRQIWDFNDLP